MSDAAAIGGPRSVPRSRRLAPVLLALAALMLSAYAGARLAGITLTGGAAIAEELAYDAVFFLAAVACLLRARHAGAERPGWTLIGLGLLVSACGYLYSSVAWMLAPDVVSFPSPADVLWVLMYPLLYAGVVRLARVRSADGSAIAIDGAIAALALAGVASVFIVPALATTAGGDAAAVITNVIYPLADIHLLGFMLLTWGLGGRAMGTVWPILLAVSTLAIVVDAVYLVQVTNDTYVWGSVLDAGWPAVAVGYAAAAFLPPARDRHAAIRRPALALILPAIATLVGIGLLADAALGHSDGGLLQVALATATLIAAAGRTVRIALVAQELQLAVTARETQLAEAQSLASIGSFEYDVAADRGRWSDELWRIHGLEPGSMVPCAATVGSLVHPDDLARFEAQFAAAVTGHGHFETSFRILRPDGRVRHVDMHGDMRDGILRASVQDVTQQRTAEESLRQSEARYRLVVENAHDGIWLLDSDHQTVFLNHRMASMLGRTPEEILGCSPLELTDARGAVRLAEGFKALEGTHGEGMQFETMFPRPGGEPLWVLISMSPLDEWGSGGSALMVSDITERKQLEERLRRAAEEDALTGLANRTAFEAAVNASGSSEAIAVALFDLDHFKHVNDSFGHGAGDDLIRHAGRVLSGALRDGDLLARFGGDEFAVLLHGVDADGALAVTERLLEALRGDHWRGLSRQSASAGIAVVSTDVPASADDLLKAADIALYEAKDAGRDRGCLYRGPDGGLAWVDEVRAAIDEKRLVLYSQRIVGLRGGGDREELLVRMIGRDGEILPPAAFIPTAEQFGLITELDSWVVGQAIDLARDGRAVEVNVSGASLDARCIPDMVTAAVRGGLDPSLLTFEVTETATVRNLEGAQGFAERLTQLGCGVALDDFGTGYGTLTYLRRLPITQLKIDMDFVRDILTEPDDERMVRTIVGMAQTLGLETVAEGVEDLAAIELLTDIGVDFAQGYAIQRPCPVVTVPVTA